MRQEDREGNSPEKDLIVELTVLKIFKFLVSLIQDRAWRAAIRCGHTGALIPVMMIATTARRQTLTKTQWCQSHERCQN
jgi:hypothetical protein